MFRREKLLVPILLLFLLLPPEASSQAEGNVVGKVGLGINGNFHFPVSTLKDRFREAVTWGTFVTYAQGPRTTVEVEYHRSRFDPGKLEESTFFWPEGSPNKWRRYKSPLARNLMTINAFTVNGLYHFVDRMAAGGGSQQVVVGPYFAFGGGFYHYTNSVSGLIFAGQPDQGTGLDDTLLLDPFKDTDVAWGGSLGGGVEVLMNNTALDVRARYHLLIGELRQMDAYGVGRTYPLQYFEIGVSIRYYIGRL
ncbi:MAG: hypothetical protein A3F84_19835 [Candidatus Handelsmanbacteria bacterium RIFCSPLOWO2_12_FULL_64_10]|uniref:Outer membrane protein beta-barrel domain-containing protein n=1 Tax=Handelsmanbacteria sp. (strain RIFCSPLOWO2_12_FULL_64_10) TaxID=1817868 RepID=A0A1F6CSI0_HANXR|nr:MAG: hypothetical protein A3F84_19835 [Candidatus Handelsmanbacteria bacterium RIFCSPLOWO2_12_FULL_64_10]